MSKKEQIQLFENRNVRTLWDEQEEDWYFSIVDVVAILTDQQDSKKASTYWSVLKGRLRKEGADEPLTKCKKLKMLAADGKSHPTDAATAQTPPLRTSSPRNGVGRPLVSIKTSRV